MGDKTKIEWTDASWTPIRAKNLTTGAVGWHCEHVSEGCRRCYADSMNARLGTKLAFKPGHRADLQIFVDQQMLTQPLRWKRPRKIFVCSMTDLFASFVPADFVDQLFAVMALCPQHTFQILTKRPDRMREYMTMPSRTLAVHMAAFPMHQEAFEKGQTDFGAISYREDAWFVQWPLPNVWLGTSVEDQANADARIPHLLASPAKIRFLSCEPLLGPIDLKGWIYAGFDGDRRLARPAASIGWVICGGESGRQARPLHPDWIRSLRDQCAAADAPFHFKQWGEWWETDSDARDDDGGHVQVETGSDLAEAMFDRKTDCLISIDGQVFRDPDVIPIDTPCRQMTRIGKAAAGRQLDGVEHDGFPT
jgi:protein gp37